MSKELCTSIFLCDYARNGSDSVVLVAVNDDDVISHQCVDSIWSAPQSIQFILLILLQSQWQHKTMHEQIIMHLYVHSAQIANTIVFMRE